jgi:nuclear pore complex protein Nup98-Nup96
MKPWSLTWTLCEALWGHLKELDSQLDEPSEYIQILERRRAFSRWLSHTAAPQIEEEVSLTRKDNPVEAVFSYLTGSRISEACSLAQQSGKEYGPLCHCLLPTHCPLSLSYEFALSSNL